jgi:hypothetical protein
VDTDRAGLRAEAFDKRSGLMAIENYHRGGTCAACDMPICDHQRRLLPRLPLRKTH